MVRPENIGKILFQNTRKIPSFMPMTSAAVDATNEIQMKFLMSATIVPNRSEYESKSEFESKLGLEGSAGMEAGRVRQRSAIYHSNMPRKQGEKR